MTRIHSLLQSMRIPGKTSTTENLKINNKLRKIFPTYVTVIILKVSLRVGLPLKEMRR